MSDPSAQAQEIVDAGFIAAKERCKKRLCLPPQALLTAETMQVLHAELCNATEAALTRTQQVTREQVQPWLRHKKECACYAYEQFHNDAHTADCGSCSCGLAARLCEVRTQEATPDA